RAPHGAGDPDARPRRREPSPDGRPRRISRDDPHLRRRGSGMSSRALDELDRVLREQKDADEVLRSTVEVLTKEPGVTWAGVAFLEDGDPALGPSAGEPDEEQRTRVPIAYRGAQVGELWVDGEVDRSLLERVAFLISEYVLIGWDTRGEAWEP